MKRLCAGGCRREARVEWMRPGEESWWLCAIHSLASTAKLTSAGWADFPVLDDRADEAPKVTSVGGHQYDTD